MAGRRGGGMMFEGGGPDAPTAEDGRRLRGARTLARKRLAQAEAVFVARSVDAFREELAATVRSVSPFLVALVGQARIDLAAERLEPVPGWPCHPIIGKGTGLTHMRHTLRHWFASGAKGVGGCSPRAGERARSDLVAGGARVFVHVVNHSVEASVRLERARLETSFGTLRIELDDPLPATLLAALPGRPVETALEHPALRGSGWTISSVREDLEPCFGPIVSVETGALPYLLPWAR